MRKLEPNLLRSAVITLLYAAGPDESVAEELERGTLRELVPGRRPEVALFWQHWRLGSTLVDELTEAVVEAARRWMAST